MLSASARIDAEPSYNVTPSQAITICRESNVRELVQVRWGLIPHWAKKAKTGYSMVNARAETVATKPAYRDAYKKRRCLIPTDGFYEWKPATPRKQPYFIHRRDSRPFALAGLWERWEMGEEPIETCTIIVTGANKLIATLHDRMPVIVESNDYEQWLDPAQDSTTLTSLLIPNEEEDLEVYPVGLAVNKPANNSPDLISRI